MILKHIKLHNKKFSLSIPESEILKSIEMLARQINIDYEGKDPLFIAVLNGAFMFASDLLKHISIECDISFVKHASYSGTQSTGVVKELIGLDTPVEGRNVILLEDIVDTGNTIKTLWESISNYKPADLKIATLLFKKEAYKLNIPIEYVCLEVPNKFLIGYGLDFDGKGRNLCDIYCLDE